MRPQLVQLTNLGIQPQFISFASLTMESEKYICIREEVNGKAQVAIIDMANTAGETKRAPIQADSAIMNPVSKVIGLKAGNYLQIYNMEMNAKMKSHQLTEPVIYWKWISPSAIAMVTGAAVFHWSMEGQSEPQKIFDRHPTLNDTQIIIYKTSPDEKWMVLIGIKSEVRAGRPRTAASRAGWRRHRPAQDDCTAHRGGRPPCVPCGHARSRAGRAARQKKRDSCVATVAAIPWSGRPSD